MLRARDGGTIAWDEPLRRGLKLAVCLQCTVLQTQSIDLPFQLHHLDFAPDRQVVKAFEGIDLFFKSPPGRL